MIEAFDLPAIGRSPGAVRFRQAGEPQRPLHPQSDDQTLVTLLRGCAALHSARRGDRGEVRRPSARKLRAMPGLKERAKTLIELIDGARFILADRPLPIDAEGAALLTAEARQSDRPAARGAGSGHAWSAETTEAAMRAFAEAQRAQARRGRAAAARGADRTHHLARNFRRAGGAGPRRKPGAAGAIRPGIEPRRRLVASVLQCTQQ